MHEVIRSLRMHGLVLQVEVIHVEPLALRPRTIRATRAAAVRLIEPHSRVTRCRRSGRRWRLDCLQLEIAAVVLHDSVVDRARLADDVFQDSRRSTRVRPASSTTVGKVYVN